MARPVSDKQRVLVEECEYISTASLRYAPWIAADLGVSLRFEGNRTWLRCPECRGNFFKLYKPPRSTVYACRRCHQLIYRQQRDHDPRMSRLANGPLETIVWLLECGKINWKVLALQAGYIKIDREEGRLPHKRLYQSRLSQRKGSPQQCAPNCAPSVPLLCPTTYHDVFGHLMVTVVKCRKYQVMRGGSW